MAIIEASPEIELFLASSVRFLQREAGPARIRALADQPGEFDASRWEEACSLGWLMPAVGSAADERMSEYPLTDLVRLAKLQGEYVGTGPLAVSAMVVNALTTGASTSVHAEIADRLVSGAARASWAVYDQGRRWTPLRPAVQASRCDGGYRLRGVKDRIEHGAAAQYLLVTASLDGSAVQFVVPTSAAGLVLEPVAGLDPSARFAVARFDDAFVPADTRLLPVGDDATAIEDQWRWLSVMKCAEAVGATGAAFKLTLQWAEDRYSFGRPLGSYQAIKHRLASARTTLEAMHAITDRAAVAVDRHEFDAGLLVRAARRFVGRQAPALLQECVQIHGGIGVTWEHDLHIYLRRVLVCHALYGTPEEMLSELRERLVQGEDPA